MKKNFMGYNTGAYESMENDRSAAVCREQSSYYDWSYDGKRKFSDDYAEHNGYYESTVEDDFEIRSSGGRTFRNPSGSSCLMWFLCIIFVLSVVMNWD